MQRAVQTERLIVPGDGGVQHLHGVDDGVQWSQRCASWRINLTLEGARSTSLSSKGYFTTTVHGAAKCWATTNFHIRGQLESLWAANSPSRLWLCVLSADAYLRFWGKVYVTTVIAAIPRQTPLFLVPIRYTAVIVMLVLSSSYQIWSASFSARNSSHAEVAEDSSAHVLHEEKWENKSFSSLQCNFQQKNCTSVYCRQ